MTIKFLTFIFWLFAWLLPTASANEPLSDTDFEELEARLSAKKYVMGIGVQEFKNNNLWPNLRFAAKDAKDFHDSLLNGDNRKSFQSAGLLQGLNRETKVLKSDVYQALRDLNEQKLNEQDTLIIYISSHGTVKYRSDGSIGRYIVMSDTDPNRVAETAIDYRELVKQFRKLKPRKKALILAFCYSGNQSSKGRLTAAMKREAALLKNGEFFSKPTDIDLSEGELILSASGWKEPASEDPSLENDIYTHYLLKGLSYDRNQDGATTLLEAHDYATEQTIDHTQGRQRPNIDLKVVGEDPFIIRGKRHRKGKPILYALEGFFRDVLVFANGKNMGSLKKGIVMPTGPVNVELKHQKTNQSLARLDRVFEAGEIYSASEFAQAPRPNRFDAGYAYMSYFNAALKERLASRNNSGFYLRYRNENTIGGWDASISASVYLPTEESILGSVVSSSSDSSSNTDGVVLREANLEQERTTLEFEAGLHASTLVAWMSSRKFGFDTQFSNGPSLGVTGFFLKDLSFGRDRFQDSNGTDNLWFPMAKYNAYFTTKWKETGIYSSVGVRAGALLTAERFEGADVMAASVTGNAGLGWSF